MATINIVDLIAPTILTVSTTIICILFIRKRQKSRVHALDWMIGIFGSTALIGLLQLLKSIFQDSIFLFKNVVDEASLGNDPVRVAHLIALLILFLMAEQFLTDNFNSLRLGLMSALIAIYIFLTIYYVASGDIIYNNEIFAFAQSTTFDSLIFDTIQLYAVGMIFYIFILQYRMSVNEEIKQFLGIIVIALSLYLISAFVELLEHFTPIYDFNAFITAMPTFLILAYFYIRHPNFAYLAPVKISFLQIVSGDGQLLYAAELKDQMEISDYLVAPSLTSVSSIIDELVDRKGTVEVKKFIYNDGFIIFETVNNIKAIIATNRPSGILKRSLRYFLREFNLAFEDQLQNYQGYIETNEKGISPDDLFTQCIPIVQSKPFISNFAKSSQ